MDINFCNANLLTQQGRINDSAEGQSVRFGLAGQEGRDVMVMATNCQPSDVGDIPRKLIDGSQIHIPRPQAIILYNRFMGGVDNGDQM